MPTDTKRPSLFGDLASFRLAFIADVRYAVRRWRHRPGFATTAILTLGLGVASATSIFSVVDAVLLKPLPWHAPESLVMVHGVYPDRRNNPATAATWNRWFLSYPAWEALRTASAFDAVGAWRYDGLADTTFGDERAEIITTLDVSSTFLPMLGVKLSLGRFFNDTEDNAFSESIILTHETWERRLGARPDVIGQRVMLGSAKFNEKLPRTIVGVIADGFQFDAVRPEVLRPIGGSFSGREGAQKTRTRASPEIRVVARLAAGVSLSSADAQAAALVSAAPNEQSGSARLVLIEDEQLGSSRRPLWLLFGSAGILLLVACSNVAGLLLSETRIRRHEFAVRAALGGSRARVFRQIAVEYGLFAIAGTTVGLMTAYWLTGALVAMAPAGMPRIEAATVDLRATMFALATGLFTLLVFGLAPASALARTPVTGVLAESGRDGGLSRPNGQRFIVVAQVALALVLLTGATLFGETMLKLHAQPLGFDPDGVAVVATTFTGSQYGNPATVKAAWQSAGSGADPGRVLGPLQRATTTARTDAVLERLSAIPGVTRVAATSAAPFVFNPLRGKIVLEARPDAEKHEVLQQVVSERYFATLGIPLVSGRGFEPRDIAGTLVAVVSSEFQHRFFPNGAIDQLFGGGERFELSTAYRIVGVVPNVKRQDPTDDDRPAFYSYDRQGGTPNYFLIGSAGDPSLLLPAVRRAIGEASPQIVVTRMTTMASRVGESVVEERFRATLSAMFGAAALLLAAVGLYGLAARRVTDRHREFGIRVALGARPRDVRQLVVRDVMMMVSMGLAVGFPPAFASAQIAASFLFGVTATSPHVFAFTGLLLAVVAMTATILPTRRAGRTNPVVALRH